ncbi:MAG: hypothetical protein H0W34_09050 [Pyrinomonadaceae bacterium]|nr:hypothetical protein [Chthoniobacterales bacterium]MBA3572101.1 hypothetical protein [Pyrinomonadaceae bacterium]
MFYWSHEDVHVVLTDHEELALVQQLSPNQWEALKYDASGVVRREMEGKISRFLKDSLSRSPEDFRKRFVFRSCYGDEAHLIFPALVNAYSRITGRAVFDEVSKPEFPPSLVEDVLYASVADLYQVTLFGRGRWPWSPREVVGRISFPACTIEKVAGSADNFFAATDSLQMKFHRDFVRISILDRPVV